MTAVWGLYNDLNCEKCTEQLKKARCCNGGGKFRIMDYEIDGCPMKNWDKLSGWINDYFFFNKGYLPESGGILDQSGIFCDVMIVLSTAVKKLEADKCQIQT